MGGFWFDPRGLKWYHKIWFYPLILLYFFIGTLIYIPYSVVALTYRPIETIREKLIKNK